MNVGDEIFVVSDPYALHGRSVRHIIKVRVKRITNRYVRWTDGPVGIQVYGKHKIRDYGVMWTDATYGSPEAYAFAAQLALDSRWTCVA